jgi:hypothetical protein|tara:strand:+ start:5118 stop:5345 length:228 start_codon:yes stop_codon:yes gene_type:complete
MKKKLQIEDLTLEMKKDIFVQVINVKEHPKATAKKYNITEHTINQICQEFIFEKIIDTDDGILDITPDNELKIED